MLKRPAWIVLLVVMLGALMIFPTTAQDESDPLLDMLAFVPDTPETLAAAPLFSYVDYRAVESTRGIETPTARDFANGTELSGLWMAAMNGVASGLPMNYFMQYVEGMPDAVGFSWFDIDRALTFGQPPAMGKVVAGDFDAEAVGAAFAARGFTETTESGATVWCGPDGCDSGQQLDLKARNPANPFGGELGRNEPVALLPGYILNSAAYTVLQAIIETQQDTSPSLAENPYIRAAAHTIGEKGTLRQTQFFNLPDVGLADPRAMLSSTDWAKGFGVLPPFRVMFLADTVDKDEQVVLIGLVYDDADTATAAADELLARIQVAQSLAAERPFLEMIEERGATVSGAYADKDDETGKAVAVLEIRSPQPDNELSDDGRYKPSGLTFRLMINAAYRRDLSILWTDIPQ